MWFHGLGLCGLKDCGTRVWSKMSGFQGLGSGLSGSSRGARPLRGFGLCGGGGGGEAAAQLSSRLMTCAKSTTAVGHNIQLLYAFRYTLQLLAPSHPLTSRMPKSTAVAAAQAVSSVFSPTYGIPVLCDVHAQASRHSFFCSDV